MDGKTWFPKLVGITMIVVLDGTVGLGDGTEDEVLLVELPQL